MITDHVWRQTYVARNQDPELRKQCAYMNCRRAASEHARQFVNGKGNQ